MMKKQYIFIAVVIVLLFCVVFYVLFRNKNGNRTDESNNLPTEQNSADTQGEKLDCIVYNGKIYCGLSMSWKVDQEPADFTAIGKYRGPYTERKEELTSTIVFHDNEELFFYSDEKGYYYFCAKKKREGEYIGLYMATMYNGEYSINLTPHELNY